MPSAGFVFQQASDLSTVNWTTVPKTTPRNLASLTMSLRFRQRPGVSSIGSASSEDEVLRWLEQETEEPETGGGKPLAEEVG